MINTKKAAAPATAILLFSATLTAGGIAPYRSSFAFKDKEIETTNYIPFVDWAASSIVSDNSTIATKTSQDSDAVPPYPGDGNDRDMRNA